MSGGRGTSAIPVALLAVLAVCGCRRASSPATPPQSPDALAAVHEALGAEPSLLSGLASKPATEAAALELGGECVAAGYPLAAALVLAPYRDSPQAAEVFLRSCDEAGWVEEADAALPEEGAAELVLLHADACSHRGRGDLAGAALRRLPLNLRPPELKAAAVEVSLRSNDVAQAVRWVETVDVHSPPVLQAAALHALLRAGRIDDALRLAAGADADADPSLRYWSARARLLSSDPATVESAVDALSGLVEDPAVGPAAAFYVGQHLVWKGDYAGAIDYLRRAADKRFQTVLAYDLSAAVHAAKGEEWRQVWSQVVVRSARGQVEQTIAALKRAMELRPADERAYFVLADTLNSENRFAEALEAIEQARQRGVDTVELATLRGSVLQALGRVDEARAAWREAARNHPERADESLTVLGRLLSENQEFAEAEEVLRQALSVNDGSPTAHYWLARTLLRRRDGHLHRTEALRELATAVKLDGSDRDAWLHLGQELERLPAMTEALLCYARALEIDPLWENGHVALARLLRRLDLDGASAFVLERYRRIRRPGGRDFHSGGTLMDLASDPELRYQAGNQAFARGRVMDACDSFLVAVSLRPRWRAAQQRLAEACAVLGYDDLWEEAQRAAKQAAK